MVQSTGIELDALAEAVGAACTINPNGVQIADLAYDSRRVPAGSLFVCVPGGTADGHDFAAAAVEAGAVALLVERVLPIAVPQLVVPDARRALAVAGTALYGDPTRELQVVGVTGTNGKTTTTFLLHAILAAARLRPGLLGTIERRIGSERWPAMLTTPESVDLQRDFRAMVDAGDRSAAVEVSSHAAALGRLVGVRFAALAFMNLTHDHLDFHETLADYFAAKRRPFVEPDADGNRPPAALNVGDPSGRALAHELSDLGVRTVTFGLTSDADVHPEDLELTTDGARFRVDGLALHSRLRGRFNVENVLASVAVARLLKIPDDAILVGIAHVRGVPGRFEAVDEGQDFAVIVDYAHTPEALANVLRAARELCEGLLICVFGCGGDRDREKRPAMGSAAIELADRVIVTSDNPRSESPEAIIREILVGAGQRAETEVDRATAIERAIGDARSGDVVVVAGKGHERGQDFGERTVPFDDREVSAEILRRITLGAPG